MKKLITAIAAIATSFGLFADGLGWTSVRSDIHSKTNNLVVGYDTTGATMLDDTGDVTVNWFADSLKTDFTTKMETYEQPELKVGEDEEGSYQYLAIDTDVKDPVLRTFNKVVEDTGDDNFKYNNIGISDHGVFIDTETTFTLFDTDPEAPSDSKILVWAKETEADADAGIEGATNLMVTCGTIDPDSGKTVSTNYVLNIDSVLPNGLQPETMYRLTIRADKEKDSDNTEFRVYLNTHQLSTVGGLAIFPSIKAQVQELGSAGFGGTGSLKSVDLLTEIDALEKVPFAVTPTFVTFTWDENVASFKIGDVELAAGDNLTTNYQITAFNQNYNVEVTYVPGWRHGEITGTGFKTLTGTDTDEVTFSIDPYTAAALTVTPEEDRDEAVLTVNGNPIDKKFCGTLLSTVLAYITENCRDNDSVVLTLGDSRKLGSIYLDQLNNLVSYYGTIELDLHGCTLESNLETIPQNGGYMFKNAGLMTIKDTVGGGAIIAQTGIDILLNCTAAVTIEQPAAGTISFTGKIVNDCYYDDDVEVMDWVYGDITLKGGRYSDKVYTSTYGDLEYDPEQEHILDGIHLGENDEMVWTDEKVDGYWLLRTPGSFTLSLTAGENNSITSEPSAESPIAEDTPVTVTVTPLEGYQFATTPAGWDAGENGTIVSNFQMMADTSIIAPDATAIPYVLTLNNNATATLASNATVPAAIPYGTSVTVTATPATGYEFATTPEGWEAGENGTVVSNFVMKGDTTITAPTATGKPVDVSLPQDLPEGVSSLVVSQKVDEAWVDVTATKKIGVGNDYVVVAIPAAGYTINNPIKSGTAAVGVNISVTKEEVEAKIGKQTFTVTVNASNATLLTNDAPVVETSFTAAYGTVLALTATAAIGYENPTIKTNGQDVTSLTITEAVTIDVAATAIAYAINVTDGTADPATFTIDGATVALAYNGTPDTGKSFSTWTATAGTVDGNTLTIPAGLTAAITVTPNFTNNVYAITYTYTDGTDPVEVTANTNPANFTYGTGVPSFDAAGLTYDTTKYENPQFSPASIGTDVAEAKTVTVTFTKKQTEPIPPLPPNPTPEQKQAAVAAVVAQNEGLAGVVTVDNYTEFRDWARATGTDPVVAEQAVIGSTKAGVSFQLSPIVEGATLFENEPVVNFTAIAGNGNNWDVTLQLKDGASGEEVELAIGDAKAHFAQFIKKGNEVNAITGTCSADDIVAAIKPGEGSKQVKLTVVPPTGGKGFIKFVAEKPTTPVP